jgi:hypothetical protein
MSWSEEHTSRQRPKEKTNKALVFPALTTYQINHGTFIAVIHDNMWAGPKHLEMEIQKSYPDAELIKHTTYTHGVPTTHDAIKLTGESATKFAEDYFEWMTPPAKDKTR